MDHDGVIVAILAVAEYNRTKIETLLWDFFRGREGATKVFPPVRILVCRNYTQSVSTRES